MPPDTNLSQPDPDSESPTSLPTNVRELRRWGDPVMSEWGRDINIVNLTNWQNLPLYNTATDTFGAIANFLWIDHEWVMYLRSLQFPETIFPNGGPVFHDQARKMNWLCRKKGSLYFDAAEWPTSERIKWGTTAIGGNVVTIEDTQQMSIPDLRPGSKNKRVKLEMAKVKCFRKADRDRTLDEMLAMGIVQRVFCVYKNNQFGDTPKGIMYSPMWSPLDWDFAGTDRPDSFWLPTIWML